MILNDQPSYTEIGYEKFDPYQIHSFNLGVNQQSYLSPETSIQLYNHLEYLQDSYVAQLKSQSISVIKTRNLFLSNHYSLLGIEMSQPSRLMAITLGHTYDKQSLYASSAIMANDQNLTSYLIAYQFQPSRLEKFSIGFGKKKHWQLSWLSHIKNISWRLTYQTQHQEFAFQISYGAGPNHEFLVSQNINSKTSNSGVTWRYYPWYLFQFP